jgi:hypothetical protein
MRYVNSLDGWIEAFVSFIFVWYHKNTHGKNFGSNLVLEYLTRKEKHYNKKLWEMNNLVTYQKDYKKVNPYQVLVLIIYLSRKL